MPTQTVQEATMTWTDITVTGAPRTAQLGRAKTIRSLILAVDWSVDISTAATAVASPAEVIDTVHLAYDDKTIDVRGRELHNLGLAFYGQQGYWGNVSATAGNAQWYSPLPVANGQTFRGAFRIPVGAPASDSQEGGGTKLTATVTLSGEATWSESAAQSASTAGTAYLFADYGPSPYAYSNFQQRNIAFGTTAIEVNPAITGRNFIGAGLVLSRDTTAWTAGATGAGIASNRHVNYYDRLARLEVKNVETVARADSPLGGIFHSCRFMGLGQGGGPTSGTARGLDNPFFPSGCYWVEGDAQTMAGTFRMYYTGTVASAADGDASIWMGTPITSGAKTETKDPSAPSVGAPARSVPVGRR